MRFLADIGKGPLAVITQMRVKGLIFDPYNNAYIVVLRDEENSDMLPIWVGKSEASAIGLALESVTAPRPMTHDLMKSFLETFDAKIISVVITDLNDNTYFATIHLMYEDSEYTVDSRPSDAIALAVRAEVPIYVAEAVMDKGGTEPEADLEHEIVDELDEEEAVDEKVDNRKLSAFADFVDTLNFDELDDKDD